MTKSKQWKEKVVKECPLGMGEIMTKEDRNGKLQKEKMMGCTLMTKKDKELGLGLKKGVGLFTDHDKEGLM